MLEQLAAGIPTIAYDIPGSAARFFDSKRDFLLTPVGDAKSMAERALQFLQFRAGTRTSNFQHNAPQLPIIIVGATSPRIRCASIDVRSIDCATSSFSPSLFRSGPRAAAPAFCARSFAMHRYRRLPFAPRRDGSSDESEIHLPLRPDFGRIERTRFNRLAHSFTPLFRRRFDRKLEKIISTSRALAVHAIAHGGS